MATVAELRAKYRYLSKHHSDDTDFLLAAVERARGELPLDDEQRAQVAAFRAEVDARILQRQRGGCNVCKGKQNDDCLHHASGPYAGAIGGATTYIITPTSLGRIIKVQVWGKDNELDITADL